MTVSPATKDQAPRITELLRYICELHAKGRPDVFVSGEPKYDEEGVCRLIDEKDTHVITAVEDGRVIGYMIAKVKDGETGPHMRGMRTLYIDDICTAPEAARRGVGAALFEEAKRIGRDNGCVRVDLNVWEFNKAAIKFYEKMGMKVSRMHMECGL